jgi:rubrerythrin
MAKHAALEVLQKALQLEESGKAFYDQAAERTVDPKGKAMFASLAEDEVVHARVITRAIASLESGKALQAEVSAEGAVDLDSPLFPAGKLALDEAIRPDAGDMDALLFALKIENDSYSLYAEQAKGATDPQARQFYEYLAGAERSHFNLLMTNYDSLSSAGSFV